MSCINLCSVMTLANVLILFVNTNKMISFCTANLVQLYENANFTGNIADSTRNLKHIVIWKRGNVTKVGVNRTLHKATDVGNRLL